MNFQDALDHRGIRYRRTGDKVHINCPFCPSRGKPADNKMRLCVHAKEGWGKCLHCDWTRRTAVNAVLKQLGITTSVSGFERSQAEQEHVTIYLPEDFSGLWENGLDDQALDYVLKRGITKEQIKRHRIGVSYSGTYAYRVIFPVYVGDNLQCINARDFTGRKKPKYLLSKGEKCLAYFEPEEPACVLSEGSIKALRIEQAVATDTCSAALLGHDLTDKQLKQIQDSQCKSVILWPDTDLVGRRGFIKIADKLSEFWSGEVAIVWPVTGPADELPLREISRLLLCNTVVYTPRIRHRMLLEK